MKAGILIFCSFPTKSGTYIFCEASDPNRPDIRNYQKLYLIDEQGKVISEDVSHILGSIKCEPTTPKVELPKNYNAMVMKVKKQFAQEVKHRQAERDYSSNLTQGQRYILRELRTLFNFTEDESQKTLINLLVPVFRNHLPQAISRELNALRRNGTTGEDLFTYLVQIYNQHDLHKLRDHQKSELKYQPIPMIICSEGLV
ncbi:MAG: hypothetical protein QNJ32_18665 [Xenococcaceae cyanobacterium MO_167.B27]|nr:hypothetical protein [Xenococcaceae cyanobacterium MO_167.B27]